jgi:hypothetical protein
MIWFILLGGLAILAGTGTLKKWLDGQGPFDKFPSGVDSQKVVSLHQTKSSSGHQYDVTEYERGPGQAYYVAVRTDDSHDWVSYLFDRKTKARVEYQLNAANVDGVAVLRKDFDL